MIFTRSLSRSGRGRWKIGNGEIGEKTWIDEIRQQEQEWKERKMKRRSIKPE
jgi:hypothetical protein